MTSSVVRAALALNAFAAISLCAAQNVQMKIDGQNVAFTDVEPQLMYDNVMVPMRTVFEKMGGDVHWDAATRTATANVHGSEIILKVGAFEATVDGKPQYLQNAPVIVDGRTLIPMQFLQNSTGAQVNWSEPDRVVSINTNGNSASTNPTTTPTDTVSLYQNEVIPITLDQSLSSTESRAGDTFTATVNSSTEYGGLPAGTKIEGHVADVQSNSEGQPAILDLAFDRIVLPNGTTAPIDGALVSLGQDYVTRDTDGIYSARNAAPRMIYTGYGSNQGMLVSAPDDRPLTENMEDSKGYLERQIPDSDRYQYDLVLSPGTEMGVRINQETSIFLAD